MTVFLYVVMFVAGITLTLALPEDDRYLGACTITIVAVLLLLTQIN